MADHAESTKELFENIEVLVHKRFPTSGQICNSIGIDIKSADIENKTAVFTHTAKEDELNFRGTMHGGIISWLFDTSMGILACAYGLTNNPTLNLNVSFLRAIYPGDKLLIVDRINTAGAHIITTEGKIYVAKEGKEDILVASATGTFYKFDRDQYLIDAFK